jgi:biopolymer transport protein ExbB/TolQ
LDNFQWGGILAKGWPVLSILFAASIIMLAVVLERRKLYALVKAQPGPFLESIKSAGDAKKIIAWCEKSDQPLAAIALGIYKSGGSRDEMERAMQRSIQALVQIYEDRINILGTIASVAPFVGLLGTVIGIIRAFQAVSLTTSGGASSVTLGISEALVGTAAGLVVAIPALLSYNHFVNKLRRFTQEWEIFGMDLIDMAQRGR